MSTASGTAAWAHAYAAVGWRCHPIRPGDKVPWLKDWPHLATTDPGMLSRWFSSDANNIGVVTGEAFDAFDIEAAHLPAFYGYMKAGGYSLPLTPVAGTGRGGRHILTAPTGRSTTKLLLNGVHIGELKGAGGFIVVMPSVTERQYAWRFAPAGMAVASAPEWLLRLIAPPPAPTEVRKVHSTREAMAALERLAVAVARTKQGNRNHLLYWAACRALEEGVPSVAVVHALTDAATDAGLDAREIRRALRSALEAQV